VENVGLKRKLGDEIKANKLKLRNQFRDFIDIHLDDIEGLVDG